MLKSIKIADFTEEELKKIALNSLSNSERRKFQQRVKCFLDKSPRDLGALVMATEMTDDMIESNAYLSRALRLSEEKGDFSGYMTIVYLAKRHNRVDVLQSAYEKAKAKYPVRARIANFILGLYLSRKEK